MESNAITYPRMIGVKEAAEIYGVCALAESR